MKKYYLISENVYLVDGKLKSCIYDLKKGMLYHINHELSDFIKKYCTNFNISLKPEEMQMLIKLKNMGIELLKNCEKKKEDIAILNKKSNIEFAWIEVCTKCNLKCIHCYNESDAMCMKEMSYDDFVIVVKQLEKMGVRKIQFIGGEPLIIGEKLKKMIKYAYEKFDSIEVFTNGTIIDDSWIDLFLKFKVKVALSVYSYFENEHEKVTQVHESFNRTNLSIQKLKEKGISYRVCNTIMNNVEIGNKESDLYVLSYKKDIVRMSGRGNLTLLNDVLIKRKLITKQNFLSPLNKKMVYKSLNQHNCFGSKIYVAADLTVYPCVMERRLIHGRINKDSEFKLDNDILSMNKDFIVGCKDCEFRYACFDCRPDALTNNPIEKPWNCTYHPEKACWDDIESSIKRVLALRENE